MDYSKLKQIAAEKAVDEIKDNMIVGLGTGSTAKFAIMKIAEKIKDGNLKNIYGIPTSKRTEDLATELGIPLLSLNQLFKKNTNHEQRTTNHEPRTTNKEQRTNPEKLANIIDITIDGADEVDSELNLIKGGGGALLREKVIAQNTKRLLIVVDKTKISEKLGTNFFVPVEVLQFALESEIKFLESLGATTKIRKTEAGELFITDEGNFIVDAYFGKIDNPAELSSLLNERAGVVEHGIFLNKLVDSVYCSSDNGVEILTAS
ncbi:ribose 5-phosphate isomerase A [Melioribacter sp. OK-6-Me]|uniref:ribose 5-phosphate isomerase A n=1 Tax=unclassified Melioribacter TaxID=2627329 RepID=UPI003ED997FE